MSLLITQASAQVPTEDFLRSELPGTWLTQINSDGVKIIGTFSYATDGTVEYRLRQAGTSQDIARWSSRYTIKQNCIDDEVIATSDEAFSAIGEKDRECVIDTQLGARRMRFQNAEGDSAWAIKVSDELSDDRCLQVIKTPACKRAFFLLSPETFELKNGQTLATSAFQMKIHGKRWAGLLREARADSDIRLVMLVDGTNVLMVMTGGEKASLSEVFQAYRAPLSSIAPDFAKHPAKTRRIRLLSGERTKINYSCGELPTKVRLCVLAGAHEKSGLSITATYVEGESSVLKMVQSIRLLTK